MPLSIAVVGIGVLFLGPFLYVAWRNIDLGTDLGEVVRSSDGITWELVLDRRKERRKNRRVRRTSTIEFIEYID